MRALLPALALAACAAGPAREAPPATLAGAPVRCIPITLIREARPESDRVIDFVMKDRRVFRNTLPAECPSLGFERRITYTTPLSELCGADFVTVLTSAPVQRGATCALGEFQPVTLTPAGRSMAGR